MKYAFIWIFALLLTGCATIKPIEDASLPNADFSQLVRVNPVPQTQLLVQDKKFAEASDYLFYFMEYDYMKEDSEAIHLSQFIQETRSSWLYRLSNIDGCWNGSSDEPEGQAAAIVCDFLVIGDLRDLAIEGNNLIQGNEIDRVNLALSTGGVATLVGGLAGGVTLAAKPAVSFLKLTNKAGKMPKWLGKTLVESAEIANKTKSLDHLKDIFSNVHGLYKTAGARTTFELLAKSKDINDFRRLAKFGNVFGNKAPTLLKVGGDDAITAFQRLGGAEKETILEASTYGKEGVKFLEKNGAEIFKSSLSSTRRRMTNLEIQFVESGRKAKIGGKEFIKRDVIFNPNYIDGMQRSNIDRMKLGLAPIGKDGNPVNLHHMKQYNDGLICELSQGEHNEYSDILHRYLGRSESEIDRSKFNRIKSDYWKRRVYDFE